MRLLPLLLSILLSCGSLNNNEVNEDGIPVSTLENEGLDTAIINKMTIDIKNQAFPNFHSLLILHHNKLVYEQYWKGTDQNWGLSQKVQFTKDELHDIRSISKSVVSACIGIAIAQGKIKSVDEKIFDFFPEYANLDTGMKSSLTIRHLLTMSAGFEWNEEISYEDPKNGETQMGESVNMIQFVLSRPMDHRPGTHWNYCAGATQLLSAIILKSTGKQVDQFAREFLFQPLGITNFEWNSYRNGDMPAAASGLRLRPRDMVKFGWLYAHEGKWNEKQIIPGGWIKESTRSQIMRDSTGAYGYQWWTWSGMVGTQHAKIIAAIGNGGQSIIIDPENDLMVISTAGNYNQSTMKDINSLLAEYIYPSLMKRNH